MIASSVFSLVASGPVEGDDEEHGDGSETRILVVEDDPNTRGVLVLLLELRGYRVLQAENGESGVEVVLRVGVDLVVTDLQLPRTSGLDLARTISRHDGSPPMIAITAGDESLARRAEESRRFVEVLRKPVDVNRLLDLADTFTGGGSS